MKRKRSMIALLAAVVLLAGLYVYLANRPQNNEQADKQPIIEISQLDLEKVIRLTLRNENTPEELVFEKHTREVEEQEEPGSDENEQPQIETFWVNAKPYEVELAQSKVTDLARSFSSLNADMLVEEQPQDLSIYGLDQPVATGTAQLEDGTRVTLHLGNKTAAGSTWYLMKEGDPRVFTVANHHGQRLSSSWSEFRSKDLPEIDTMNLTYMHLSAEGRKDIEIRMNENLLDEELTFGVNLYSLTKPYKRYKGANSRKLGEMLESLAGLKIREFVEDHPEDYSQYGLDQPKLHFVVKDETTTLDLSFGHSLGDGTIYFKTGDSDGVYLMEETAMAFLDVEPFELSDKFALMVNIDDVDRITLEGRGRRHTMRITRTTVEPEEEGEEEEEVETYFLDEKQVEEDPFKKFYQRLIGIVVDAEKEHTAAGGTPELKITYHLNKGKQRNATLELYPYDADFYSLVLDGDMESEFLVYRKQPEWVFETLDDLIAGRMDE